MEIKRNRVTVTKEEAANGSCPTDPSWGISMLKRYGLELASKSEKLRPLLLCPGIVVPAGYEFGQEEEITQSEDLKEDPPDPPAPTDLEEEEEIQGPGPETR